MILTVIFALITLFAVFVAVWTRRTQKDWILTGLWLMLAGVALGAGFIWAVVT